jgi:hypothetical protein
MHRYIRRKRLISIISSLDAPKSILETKKHPKNSLFWANMYKKNPKKPPGWVFLNKNPGFFQPCLGELELLPLEEEELAALLAGLHAPRAVHRS